MIAIKTQQRPVELKFSQYAQMYFQADMESQGKYAQPVFREKLSIV
jgi:hypothetical protein